MGERLGQHFLHNQSILKRIAALACPHRVGRVIEIGAGRGALTKHLLACGAEVVAIELDGRLAEGLRAHFREEFRLTVVEGDVLRTDLAQWGPAAVAGNLPYYITSPVIAKVVRLGHLLEQAVLLVQREVAERLAATPGSRDYGFLSVETKLFAEAEMLFTVPPGAFSPPPKVDSAVIRLTPKTAPVAEEAEGFLTFAAACFRHKRKTLRNNLARLYGRDVVAGFEEGSQRAEQLSLDQLKSLYRRLSTP